MSRSAPARPALLRTLNDRTVLELLLAHGATSRTDLATLTGLSKPTIGEALHRLELGGLIADVGETVGRRGPNGRLYDLVTTDWYAAALSVTPARLTCDVVDVRGTVVGTATAGRSTLPREAGATTRSLVDAAAAEAGLSSAVVGDVVIGLPGSYEPRLDQVRYADGIPEWTRPGLRATVLRALPAGTAVTIENDVNLALLAERDAGTARDSDVTSLLWLAAGIGLATDLDGTLYRGASGGAGEIGYIPVPAPAATGRRRSTHADFQDLVGGAAVLRLAREHGRSARKADLAVSRAVAAHADDPAASAFLDELARRIALGLAVIVAVLDPVTVVLGGEVGRAGGDVLARRTARALRAVSPLTARVVASGVDGDPALTGARTMAADNSRRRMLDAADRATAPPLPARPRPNAQPLPRTAEEVH